MTNMNSTANKTLTGARWASSTKTSGTELPDCFTAATVAAAAKATHMGRKADSDDLRRLARKVAKLGKRVGRDDPNPCK